MLNGWKVELSDITHHLQILIYGFTGIHNFAGVAAFSALNGIAYGKLLTVIIADGTKSQYEYFWLTYETYSLPYYLVAS